MTQPDPSGHLPGLAPPVTRPEHMGRMALVLQVERLEAEVTRLREERQALADLTDGLPFDEGDSDERLIERAIQYAQTAWATR